MDTITFIKKCKELHNNIYDYSLVEYINYNIPVKIICKKHGIFYQKPTDHKNKKRGCQKCGMEKAGHNRYTKEKFIKKCKEIHNNIYDYSLVKYINTRSKITIICSKHGKFNQKANSHLMSKGCPICRSSKGELKIEKILLNNNIKFDRQYKFKNCKSKKNYKLRFDFYLPKENICIEYDGRHHYEVIENWGGKKRLTEYKINDNIKNRYCESNKIILYRIKFDQDIDQEMIKIIKTIDVCR